MSQRKRWRPIDRVAIIAAVLAIVLLSIAAWPGTIGAGAATDVLVVADLRGQALVVLDPSHPEGARRIVLPGGPHELLALPDGRVAVSLEQSGSIALVDLARGTAEVRSVGGLPHGLALGRAADGTALLLVTDRATDAVRRFDLGDFTERALIGVGAWPHAVATLDADRVAVAVAHADAVWLVGGGARDRVIATSALPETIDVDAARRRIATAGALGDTVEVMDWPGERVASYPVPGGRPVRVRYAPDGTLAVALSAAHAVEVISPQGAARRLPVVGTPDGLAFSSDSRVLYAADMAGGRLTAVAVSSGAVLAVISIGRSAGSILVLPASTAGG